jgi:hypothetical protein
MNRELPKQPLAAREAHEALLELKRGLMTRQRRFVPRNLNHFMSLQCTLRTIACVGLFVT